MSYLLPHRSSRGKHVQLISLLTPLAGNMCAAHVVPIAHTGQKCGDEQLSTAKALKTYADDLSPTRYRAQAGKTCADELMPIAPPGKTSS